MIPEKVRQLKQDYIDIHDDRLKWDLIKSDVRQLTIDYSKTQAYIKRSAEKELLKQLNETHISLKLVHDLPQKPKNTQKRKKRRIFQNEPQRNLMNSQVSNQIYFDFRHFLQGITEKNHSLS